MTLHWWMHWFWVTTLLLLVGSQRACAYPQPEERARVPAAAAEVAGEAEQVTEAAGEARPVVEPAGAAAEAVEPAGAVVEAEVEEPAAVEKPAAVERRGKAIYVPTKATVAPAAVVATAATAAEAAGVAPGAAATASSPREPPPAPTVSKLYYESLADRKTLEKSPESKRPNATVAPPTAEHAGSTAAAPETTAAAAATRTTTPQPAAARRDNLTRAAAAGGGGGGGSALDAGVVAGIAVSALAAAAVAGTSGFVLYRRRYINKPQALHDKCSNPDSSGYLDDTTVRENSEEMYSLDNDSFLNSLEAMTIQNYWTDSVKHSKL